LCLFICSVQAGNGEAVLADFEETIPCSETGSLIGFRKMDCMRGTIVHNGAEGSTSSAFFRLVGSKNSSPVKTDLFFQGKERRMYLATKKPAYIENGPNALSFWVKLNPDSVLINRAEKRVTFGVWTYHWEWGDQKVGGESNQGLATDSMMHGYANFGFNSEAAGKWVQVVLTPSAFKQSRYYYHFFAARGTTDYMKFYPSVRQLQFHFFPAFTEEQNLQIDQLKLVYLEPVAVFQNDFHSSSTSRYAGDMSVPVVIVNPSARDRTFRVFISSVIGVGRKVLYDAHTLTDGFEAPRLLQKVTDSDGGLGAVELLDKDGSPVIRKGEEIAISAGQSWRGELVHHITAPMVGKKKTIRIGKYTLTAQRNTLTTSVIVWDPHDDSTENMRYLDVLPSKADDVRRSPPPGFPLQRRPQKGWRSEDVPINQVAGYFVSVLELTEE